MVPAGALSRIQHVVIGGFTNKPLEGSSPDTSARPTHRQQHERYDLRPLRPRGLIQRLPPRRMKLATTSYVPPPRRTTSPVVRSQGVETRWGGWISRARARVP
jgi:hypothetical protein